MTTAEGWAGWAILELMGHRRLGGYVREVTLAGAGFFRIDIPDDCQGGVSAKWCPKHGTCKCPRPEEAMDSATCPLHSPTSGHRGDLEFAATQFYPPGSLYCLTPCGEAEARAVARQNRPQPVHSYEMARLPAPPPPARCEHEVPLDEICPACEDEAAFGGEA